MKRKVYERLKECQNENRYIFNHVFPRIYYDKMMETNMDLIDSGKRIRGAQAFFDLNADGK